MNNHNSKTSCKIVSHSYLRTISDLSSSPNYYFFMCFLQIKKTMWDSSLQEAALECVSSPLKENTILSIASKL